MNTAEPSRAKFSIPSIIAFITASLSFATGAFWGFVLAGIAIIFGIVGVLLAFSPSIRGGMVSTVSLIIGFVGLIVAVVKAVQWLL
jgi:hypothetical protein